MEYQFKNIIVAELEENQLLMAEEERQQLLCQTVLNLHQLAQMEVAQITTTMVGVSVKEVKAIIAAFEESEF